MTGDVVSGQLRYTNGDTCVPGHRVRHPHHHRLALQPRKHRLLAILADDITVAVLWAGRLTYTTLASTFIPSTGWPMSDCTTPVKHQRDGVNVQVLADPAGQRVWASPALPGATHDLTRPVPPV